MRSYLSLASVYDRWTHNFDYTRAADVLARAMPQGLPGAEVLDLCCGTGTFAAILASAGAHVTGVDQSAPMLEVAHRRFAGLPVDSRPCLLHQEIQQIEFADAKFDAAVSTLDSLNYLSLKQLRQVFTSVRRSLKPGGVFLFDVNTPYKLREVFGNSVYAEAHEDYAYIWRNTLESTTIRFDIELFKAMQGSLMYERTRETHLQHIFEMDVVCNELVHAKLGRVEVRDDYTDRHLRPDTLRANFMGWAT